MKKLGILFLLWSACLLSCKKDDKASASPEELLAKSEWKLKSVGTYTNGVIQILPDALLPITDCRRDNVYVFYSNFTGKLQEGATKCQPADPDETPFTWALTADKKTLQLSVPLFNFFEGELTVHQVTDTKLILIVKHTIGSVTSDFALEFQH